MFTKILIVPLTLASLLCVFNISEIYAEKATQAEMQLVCQNWLAYMVYQRGAWAGDTSPQIVKVDELTENDTVLGRCFSIAPQGYVVVPIIKELPPIKAYSERCRFDVNQRVGFPQLLKDVLLDRARRYARAYGSLDAVQPGSGEVFLGREHKAEWQQFLKSKDEFESDLREGKFLALEEKGPLLTTSWHQGSPYNKLCPAGNTSCPICPDTVTLPAFPTAVGCVATAAAQIMKYHNWPPCGTKSHSYSWDGDQSCGDAVAGSTLSATFSDPYDWDNMLDDYSGGYTSQQADAVAELCYEVGVAFEMDYGVCGSAASTARALTVFPEYFRYDSSIDPVVRKGKTPEQWFSIIQEQINDSLPMQYRILSHSIVCDGWRDSSGLNQYHMNYGWFGGEHTAWYTVDRLYCPRVLPDSVCPETLEYLIRNITPLAILEAEIDWNPKSFIKPYIHIANGEDTTIYITLENIGLKQLSITSVSESADWISIGSYDCALEACGSPTKVPIIISGAGKSEEFLVDSINITSTDEAGNDNIWVNVHTVVSDMFKHPEWDSLKNPTLIVWNSNAGNTGKQGTQRAGFYIPAENISLLYDSSPVLATTNSNWDTTVARWIFNHHYTQAATGIVVDTSEHLKTIYSEAEFWPITPQIPPPYHWQWLWWRIKVKDLIFYSEEGKTYVVPPADRKDEQYICLKTIQLTHDPPPEWWCHRDTIPPGTVPDAYLGMALDIDCPSDSGVKNEPGNDPDLRVGYLQGLGPGKENYFMGIAHQDTCHQFAPDSFWCWPDIDRPDVTPEQPFNMHVLRYDAFVYPQGGYRDDSLYKYMSIPGYSIYGDGRWEDYNIVTTGRVISTHAPSDTVIELRYAIVISDGHKAKLDTLIKIIKCGNANRDFRIDILDIVYFINYQFKSGPEPWRYMCDCNGDGQVTISDIVYLVNYVFRGGKPPMCSSI